MSTFWGEKIIMSIAVLTEVYDEMRRLAIAGSGLAGDDFRLKKLVAPLRKSGAKVPVMGKVADAIERLIDGPSKTSAEAQQDNEETML